MKDQSLITKFASWVAEQAYPSKAYPHLDEQTKFKLLATIAQQGASLATTWSVGAPSGQHLWLSPKGTTINAGADHFRYVGGAEKGVKMMGRGWSRVNDTPSGLSLESKVNDFFKLPEPTKRFVLNTLKEGKNVFLDLPNKSYVLLSDKVGMGLKELLKIGAIK